MFCNTFALLISHSDTKNTIMLSKLSSLVMLDSGGTLHFVTHSNCIFFSFCTGSKYRYYRLFLVGIVVDFSKFHLHVKMNDNFLVFSFTYNPLLLPIHCILSLKSEPIFFNRYKSFVPLPENWESTVFCMFIILKYQKYNLQHCCEALYIR